MCNDNVRVIVDFCGKIIVWIIFLSNVVKCDLIFIIRFFFVDKGCVRILK